MSLLRTLLPLALAGALAAQTPLSGAIHDGAGGPLLSGVVYHAVGNLSVPLGETLTIQAGAIVKFRGQTFTVAGTLRCLGSAAAPVVLTSLLDDSAGGDTNGDGPSDGAVNDWFGVNFGAAAGASALQHTSVRFTGAGGWAAIMLTDSDPAFTDCEFRDGGRGGVRAVPGSRPSVVRCRFERLQGAPAIHGLDLEAIPGLVDNTAVACPGGNSVRVERGTVSGGSVIGARNGFGDVITFATNIVVDPGATLDIGAGTILKFISTRTMTVSGTLTVGGTAVRPVVFTAFADDSAGGDTNGDGPSAGVPLAWFGITFTDGADASVVQHASVRYTGAGGWAAVTCTSADITLTDCELRDCGRGGLQCNTAARPQVARCTVRRASVLPAIYGVDLAAVAGFDANVAVDCPGGSYLRVDTANLGSDLVVGPPNVPGGVLVLNNNATVQQGVTLTLESGLVLKVASTRTFVVNGTLLSGGAETDPVVLTSFVDDDFGGDTNGDGASSAVPNQWFGLLFNDGSDASRLEHTVVRATGVGGWAAVDCSAADIVLENCRVRDSGRAGLRCRGAARPTLRDCRFENVVSEPAVTGVELEAVQNFADNEAVNCPGGAYIRVDDAALGGDAVVNRRNQINGVLVIASNLVVPGGTRLVANAGVVFKFDAARTATVSGDLLVRGLVVFTTIRDDAHGGDTNQDGSATSPAPGGWFGLRVEAGATGVLDRALFRFAGAGGWEGLRCSASAVVVSRSRAEFASRDGMLLTAAAAAQGLTAYGNAATGIVLGVGVPTLIRSTSAFNGGGGIVAAAGWAGQVSSCIAHGNGGGGFVGFPVGAIRYSDGAGIGGGVGNLAVDPQFVDPGIGDLRLAAGSPCIDAGNPGDVTLQTDALNFPRYLDGDLDGAQRIDMGAHEYSHTILFVSGDGAPGTTLTVSYSSTPAIALGALVLGLPASSPVPLLNFGPLYVDLAGPYDALAVATAGSTAIPVPVGVPTPLPLQFQFLGLATPFPRGNLSNPVFVEIR